MAKQNSISDIITQIEKQYGKGSIMQMDCSKYADIEGISTGSLSLDLALGGKGVPRGRITELFGPESSGKTTLALTVAANAQKEGGRVAFIDAEHSLDVKWAQKLGVDVSTLVLSQPDTGEQALDIVEILLDSNLFDAVVVDSVAALIPKAELEGEMGDSHMGLQARLMSQAMRKLTGAISKSKTALIFINQIRMKIGIMFGNPITTSGGNALKFYSSIRVDIKKVSTLKDSENAIGNHVKAKVVKNKIAPPFREAEFDIMFDSGISYESDLINLALEKGIIEQKGSWFTMGEEKLGQGKENLRLLLVSNSELKNKLKQEILK